MDVVQLSDLHFGNKEATFDRRELAKSLADFLKSRTVNPVLVVSGDVTFKGDGNGYKFALDFFDILINEGVFERKRIIVCPGNHDIVADRFSAFDSFSYSLRRDNKCCFSDNNYCDIFIDNAVFKVLNTSYHLDHRYGLVDANCLNMDYDKCNSLKVAVMHHHILNMFKDDTSAVRNAFDLVKYLERNNFKYLFHGHQHAEQIYSFGETPTKVISARSANYQMKGFLNSFNVYRINGESLAIEAFVPEIKNSSKIDFLELK